jgi:hypothetical protein
MSHDYIASLLIAERMADLRHEADQDRLARLARTGQPRRPRWWERLMLFRTRPAAGTGSHRHAAAVAVGNPPC